MPSTTAVTDEQGTTHYYEPVTDDEGNISTTAKNKGVFAEIETQSNGKAVKKRMVNMLPTNILLPCRLKM